jgi:DNA-binding LytR/AlgR family response regulator
MAAIRIVIVEDDWIIAKEISLSLHDLGFEVIGHYDTGEDALKNIPDLKPDIVLFDIGLNGELNGIDTAKKLNEVFPVPFIFLTALADTSTIEKAKLIEPYGYLVKPVKQETLYSTIEITLYNAAQRKQLAPSVINEQAISSDAIFVKTKSKLEKHCLEDVLWVEAADIYSLLYTVKGKSLLNSSLKTVEEKLPASKFIRIHRSFIVHINKIDAIEEDELIIHNHRIPIGKTFKEKLMNRLSVL